ncbi:signal transduction histidine kinase [Flavobacterium limnosediminis JC2902]|uniref:Signal transduction histidine kinase n=2 Tax=Flavobacterium TaxID=237 RepID=V6SXR0_9FLAO|nr:signal transduction histidine kinase [Flavobacterium limnosediminis JC2902]
MEKKILLFFLIMVLIGCNRKEEITLSKSEKSEINTLIEKSNDFKLSKTSRLNFTKEAYKLLNGKKDSVSIGYLLKVADRFYNVGEYDEFFKISRNIYQLSIDKKDSINIAKSLSNIADYHFFYFKNDSAFTYYVKAEKIYRQIGENKISNIILYNKANILLYENNFSQCETDIIKVLKRATLENDVRLVYNCYLTLGKTSRGMGNNLTAIDYYGKALSLANKLTNDPQYSILKAQSLNYIAIVLQEEGLFSEALHKSKRALGYDDFKKSEPHFFCYLSNTLAYSKFKLGDGDCLKLFNETLKIGDSLESIPVQLTSKLYLSEYYLSKENLDRAFFFADDVRRTAHQQKVFEDELKALELLAKIDPSNDSAYNKRYITLNDSLQDVERATRNKFARIEFETDEITNEKNIAEAEKEKISAQRWMILGFSLFFIVLILLFYVSRLQRSRNRELRHLQQQQEANQEIYRLMLNQQQKIEEGKQIEKRRISKELHDGVMGKLTAIRLNLFVLGKKNDPETIAKCLEHVDEIQNIEKEIRKISHDLNHNLFTDASDFVQMVNNLVDNIKGHSPLNFRIIADEKIDWNAINSEVKMQVYRILQEALHNIEKYAQARNVCVSMTEKDGCLNVSITDDGIGFDSKTIKPGIGHKNMKERAAEINSELTIMSELGKGTQINLTIIT